MKRTFTRVELDTLGVPWENCVHTEQVDSGRWSTHHVCVFRAEPDGPLWQVAYQLPATERQECDLWHDEDPVEAVQVEPHEVTVVEYRPVPDEVWGPGTNSGHGHVWPRPDGLLNRCGGPALCGPCKADQARFDAL